MSALGQKRTFAVQNRMSAFPPKADMCSATRCVRFVPIADMALMSRHLWRDFNVGPEEDFGCCGDCLFRGPRQSIF